MAYRRYAKKKVIRKKRTYRRRMNRMYRRRQAADKGHLEKITRRYSLTVDAGGQFAALQLNWIATGVPAANEAFFTGGGVNISQQF